MDKASEPSWGMMIDCLESAISRIVASRYLDLAFYQRSAGRTFSSPREAARHYLEEGARRGLNPSQFFDTDFYNTRYGEVRAAGTNPLEHFLRAGRAEGRVSTLGGRVLARRPEAPDPLDFKRLARLGITALRETAAMTDETRAVDVVVPVYRGLEDTLACLWSVLTSRNETPFRLIVIDDASPDENLRSALDELAAMQLITLVRHRQNLGFVRSANEAGQLSLQRDLLLLNADTIVSGDWLDRLRAHTLRGIQVASVTPLSNNATVLSYPRSECDNNQLLEVPYDELDSIISVENHGNSLEIPTGVGFCFYITRKAICDIGLFDERIFDRGYGEENDYCQRAFERGWSNLAALDVFVRHTGNVSFADTAVAAKEKAQAKLEFLHPGYARRIEAFRQRDPLAQTRRSLDVSRVRRASKNRGVLMIAHTWGGGTVRYVDFEADRLSKVGIPVLIGTAAKDGQQVELRGFGTLDVPNLGALDLVDEAKAVDELGALEMASVEIHALIGFAPKQVERLIKIFSRAKLIWDVIIHDYAAICPRIYMVDNSGGYCSSPSPHYCQICIGRAGTQFGNVDIDEWRSAHALSLYGARRVIVPHEDVARRLALYLPNLRNIGVRRHPYMAPRASRETPPPPNRTIRGDGRRVIGVIGAIGPHKGSRLLVALATDAQLRNLPLHFNIYGYSDDDDRLGRLERVSMTGRYVDEDLDALLERHPCDFTLFPSVGPETFCFTLDHAFRNGLFPVAFDLGAPSARIKEAGFGCVLERALMFDPQALNDRLVSLKLFPPPRWPVTEAGRARHNGEPF